MHQKRRKPYAERSCRQKKRIYIRAKNRIRKTAKHLGGLFYSHDYLFGKNGWVDCYFIGKNRTVYFCALQTTRYAYKEAVNDAAFDAADDLVAYPVGRMTFGPIDPKTGLGEVHMEDEGAKAEFGGITRHEWQEKEAPRIADSGSIKVFEKVSLHRNYSHSVGLHATLDVPYLTVESINAFIRAFIANGEKPFRKSEPFTYKHADIEYWGLESNAIVDPCKHPPQEDSGDTPSC